MSVGFCRGVILKIPHRFIVHPLCVILSGGEVAERPNGVEVLERERQECREPIQNLTRKIAKRFNEEGISERFMTRFSA
jgi:hypothetical protein